MAIQILKTNGTPRVEVVIDGDLHLEAWENPDIKVVADEEMLKMRELDGVIYITSEDDGTIYVPIGASVVVKRTGGDADIRGLAEKLTVQTVGGDMTVQRTAGLEVTTVGGDCDLRTITGPVLVKTVGGDLLGLDLQDDLNADTVGGDAELELVKGDLVVHTGGDVQAVLLQPGENGAVVHAGGDIELHFTPGAGISLVAHCGSNDIELDFNGHSTDLDSSNLVQTIGDGSIKVVAQAGGDVELTDRPWDLSRRYQSFDASDERWSRWEEKMHQHEETMRARMEEVSRRTSQASRKVEEKIQAAMRRMEQKRSGWVPPAPPAPFAPHAPREARVSEEERAVILQMLQDKKINAEEAERLLEALEGQE